VCEGLVKKRRVGEGWEEGGWREGNEKGGEEDGRG